MIRCENCGSGYSAQAAATWDSCPRCLAKHKVHTPLTFELGWRQTSDDSNSDSDSAPAEEASETDRRDAPLPMAAEGPQIVLATD